MFLNVFYHLRHPLYALERLQSVTKKLLILRTHVDLIDIQRPALAFYPANELVDDPTNWFGPNPSAVVGLLRAAGSRKVTIVAQGNPDRRRSIEEITSARLVVHAEP